MTGNIIFVGIVIMVFITAHEGGRRGLFDMLVPILTILSSVFVLAAVLPDFGERLREDASRLEGREIIIDILAFAVTFFLMRLLFRFFLKIISPIADLPVIGGINRMLGFVAGFVMGVLIVWLVFFLIIFFMGQSEISEKLSGFLNESPPLKFIYNNNWLMTMIHKIVFSK